MDEMQKTLGKKDRELNDLRKHVNYLQGQL